MTSILLLCLIAPADSSGEEFFEKKIRPVLVKHCFRCHSPTGKIRGGLRLDSRAAMLKGGDLGPAIVSGDIAKSRLIEAIGYKNVDLQMPPAGKLSDAVLADLAAWIKMGAPWPNGDKPTDVVEKFDLARRKATHWAWQPIRDPAVPDVTNSAWPRTSADRFLLAKLEKARLAPAPDTDRYSLLRRASFDLIGLPPTPEEIETFLADKRPDAFERVIERLLDSPRFGEKWARHWLDLVRYAETRGHEFDFPIPNAYRYRDYVIRALNRDLPYDRLVVEHLAGDLVATPRLYQGANESILGTGFYFFGEEIHSPVDIKADQADRFDNRIDVMSKTFLGLTVSCARCHDHKFDAISTKDYYALYGFLESSRYRQVRVDGWKSNREVATRLAGVRSKMSSLVAAEISRKAQPMLDKLAESLAADPAWKRAGPTASASPDNEWMPDDVGFTKRLAGELSLNGTALSVSPRTSTAFDTFWRGMRNRGDSEPGSLGRFQAGRIVRSPSFKIATGRVHALVRGSASLHASVGSHVMHAGPLHGRLIQNLGGAKDFRWVTIDLKLYAGQFAHLEFSATSDDFAVARMTQGAAPPPLVAARPRTHRVLSLPVSQRPAAFRILLAETLHHLEAGTLAGDEERAALLAWMMPRLDLSGTVTKWREAESALSKDVVLESRLAPAMDDGNGVNEPVFLRGSSRAPGEIVPRRFLEALAGDAPLKTAHGSGRLELARRFVDSPLAPRVIVNRLWHHLFGRGIVPTVDDFGVMGQAPTHPELLDHLATRFVREGWSIKSAIREMMLSRAYRMSSRSSDADKVDPENRLWHRAQLRRLPGEAIRDSLLSMSGELRPVMFGPSVAVHLNEFQEGRGRPASGPLDGAGRRALYQSVRRNFLSSFLLAFDTPAPFSTVGRRTVSNVPAQSLILMNDPFVQQQSALWGRRTTGTPAEKVRRMYLSAFGRPPTSEEVAACVEFAGADGWADLAHSLVNVKEFIFLR